MLSCIVRCERRDGGELKEETWPTMPSRGQQECAVGRRLVGGETEEIEH
jgi:hypothetical protein